MTDRETLEETINAIHACAGMCMTLHVDRLHQLAKAAQAHLGTLPKTKMVEVWHVEWVSSLKDLNVWVCADKVIAEARALKLKDNDAECVRVTGPHSHEVPSP